MVIAATEPFFIGALVSNQPPLDLRVFAGELVELIDQQAQE